MRKLTILYDRSCRFCRWCCQWLADQPAYLELEFVARDADEVARRWPHLASDNAAEELLVIDDAGGVYRGEKAYLMVLYALRRHRGLALRLSKPALRPLARRAFRAVARHRHRLSLFVSDEELADRLRRISDPLCRERTCATDRLHATEERARRKDHAVSAGREGVHA